MFGSYRKSGQTENHFCVDCKIRAHSCKSISSFIFTSNHLHSSHNTPSSSQITHSSHSPTVLSILSHTHSSPIAHPSTDESFDRTSKHRQVAPQHRRDRTTNPPTDWPTSSTGEIAPRTHELIDPPSEWPTPRSTHLVHQQVAPTNRSLSVPLSRLVLWFWFFFFDFCFLCCLYILILCNNICLDPKKMWEIW